MKFIKPTIVQFLQKKKEKLQIFPRIKLNLISEDMLKSSFKLKCLLLKEEYTVFLVRAFTRLLRLCNKKENLLFSYCNRGN